MKDMLPLSSVGLEWVVPALVGTGVGLLLSHVDKKAEALEELEVKTS